MLFFVTNPVDRFNSITFPSAVISQHPSQNIVQWIAFLHNPISEAEAVEDL